MYTGVKFKITSSLDSLGSVRTNKNIEIIDGALNNIEIVYFKK